MKPDEAEYAYFSRMEQKLDSFERLVDEQDFFNLSSDQLGGVQYTGENLHIYPRFRINLKDLTNLPGVHDVTYVPEGGILVNYDPERKVSADSIGFTLEQINVLCNTLGQRQVSEYIKWALYNKDFSNKVTEEQDRKINQVALLFHERR